MRSEGGYFAAGAAAGVDQIGFFQPMPSLEIKMAALALKNRFSAPIQSHPNKVIHRIAREGIRAAVGIEVLHTKQDPSASFDGTPVRHRKCEGVPEVQMSRGRGGEASDIIHGFPIRVGQADI
jgi:hypothetical protein